MYFVVSVDDGEENSSFGWLAVKKTSELNVLDRFHRVKERFISCFGELRSRGLLMVALVLCLMFLLTNVYTPKIV